MGLAIRCYEIFSTIATIDSDRQQQIFVDFLWKHFPKYIYEIQRQKGSFAPKSFFFQRTKNTDEITERLCVYQLILGKYYFEKRIDNPQNIEINDDLSILFQYAVLISAPMQKESLSGRISEVEKDLRKQLLNDCSEAILQSFFKKDDSLCLENLANHLGNDSVLMFKFTEKDGNVLARNICEWFKQRIANQDIYDDIKKLPLKDLMHPKDLNAFELDIDKERSMSAEINLNYIRLMYAYGKTIQNDLDELIDMQIAVISDDNSDDNMVSSKDFRKIQTDLMNKTQLLKKKQEKLNHMQLLLNKEREKTQEYKKKYQEISSSIHELEQLIDGISDEKVKVVNIESDEENDFPPNTVLFGGHPNWIRKFKLKYPDVKIYDADDMSFTPDVIRNADLVLINTSHMSHKQYRPVIRVVRQYRKDVKYVK